MMENTSSVQDSLEISDRPVHRKHRGESPRSSVTLTDLQRRLLAGKAGLLELALLRETHRRLVNDMHQQFRKLSTGSTEEEVVRSRLQHSQSTVSNSSDDNQIWPTTEEDSDDVFDSNTSQNNRIIDSPESETRQRCMSELHCRSKSKDNSSSTQILEPLHRCQSESVHPNSSNRELDLSEAYMRPLVFSGTTYDFPSPLHAILTQFDLNSNSLETSTCQTSGKVGETNFLRTLESSFEELECPVQIDSEKLNCFDPENDSSKEKVKRKPMLVRQSRVTSFMTETGTSFPESYDLKECSDNFNTSSGSVKNGNAQTNDLEVPRKIEERKEDTLKPQELPDDVHKLFCDSDEDYLSVGTSIRQHPDSGDEESQTVSSPSLKKTFSLGEEGYFSSNESLIGTGPQRPPRRRPKMVSKKIVDRDASFGDSFLQDSPRKGRSRTRLLSELESDDRIPVLI